MKSPCISVVVPTHNCQQYLAQALDSIIAQGCDDIEIIVVDDGSTDGTASLVEKVSDVRYVFQTQAGAAAARNAGVRIASGELIAFLDADDIWMPGKLALQLAALAQDADLDLVFGHVMEFVSPEIEAREEQTIRKYVAGYVPGTMLARSKSLRRVGDLSTQWRVGEFIDWFLKAQDQGAKSVLLGEVLMKRRLHKTNLGLRERASQSDYASIIKAALDRRRHSTLV